MDRKFVVLICTLSLLVFAYFVWSGIEIDNTTGILRVNSPGATLTITDPNYESTNIGYGAASVRLRPGTYQVIATKGREQTIVDATVIKHRTTSKKIVISSNNNQLDKNEQANKLIEQLPMIGPASQFEINYEYKDINNVETPYIVIGAPDVQGDQAAINWIKKLGYNPANFNIIYQNQSVSNYHPSN